ncbi:hypothetical protein FIBSPDRAFT_940706 [Athelia psychrophila]|uniref:Uncharacterized protein n=1 Tax=Athelia psychrophila TaxID=1759441 RepID=A0A167VGF3_9AGAM|nr:hypothetical protein FIBSPDRAFT_940706 [Fibularhizoctonia sp. CBS 109695]
MWSRSTRYHYCVTNTRRRATKFPVASSGKICPLQEELALLRSANLGLANEVSTVRAAKRLLEGDMEVERNVRRRLERQLVLKEGVGRLAGAMIEEGREKAECRAKKDSYLPAALQLQRQRLGP